MPAKTKRLSYGIWTGDWFAHLKSHSGPGENGLPMRKRRLHNESRKDSLLAAVRRTELSTWNLQTGELSRTLEGIQI